MMNRAERRKRGIKTKVPTYNLNEEAINKIKQEATQKACNLAFVFMLAIPCMIIHDKFGDIMKKEKRVQRFAEMVLELYDTYNNHPELGVTLEALYKVLEEEAGLNIEDLRKEFEGYIKGC